MGTVTGIARFVLAAGLALAALAVAPVALADEQSFDFGGDRFVAGQTVSSGTGTSGDVFAAGYDVSTGSPVGGNAHLAGFNVSAGADITGSLYAIGYSVTVKAPIGGNVTAFGKDVTLSPAATIGGNVRLGGAAVTLSAPVTGSALISAETLSLDAVVSGDFAFTGRSISFGPNARILGTLRIAAPEAIAVPESVASADRVSFIKVDTPEVTRQTAETAMIATHGVGNWLWAPIGWWVALIVVGLIAIAAAPRFTRSIETVSTDRFWPTLGLGLIALCTLVGLVPVLAITLVGLLLVPFALLFDALIFIGAYIAGAYLATRRLSQGFVKAEGNGARLILLVVAVILAGLVGHVPVLGWFVGPVLTLYGLGILVRQRFARPPQAPDAIDLPPAPPAPPVPV